MARRMSNRERIQRQAMEAAARAKENAEKKATKATAGKAKAKAKKKKPGGLKIVWTVFDDRLEEVATFPYPEKAAAEAKAAGLSEESGKRHVVTPVKVPIDDDD